MMRIILFLSLINIQYVLKRHNEPGCVSDDFWNTEIKEWDHGYLVVMAKYSHNSCAEEEYIDLIPILEDLYIDVENFINRIKEVRLQSA